MSDQTLLVRTDPKSSSKEPRRLAVGSQFRIVLMMGDNLNDFAEVFEKGTTTADRLAAVENNKCRFGTRFVVLPNVMYGDWENAAYGYGRAVIECASARQG